MTDTIEHLECDVPPAVPLLVLKSTVLFPLQVASVQIATRSNQRLLEDHPDPGEIVGAGFLVDPDGPRLRRNLGPVAVACRVLSRIEMGKGSTQIVVQGLRRLRIGKLVAHRPYFRAEVTCLDGSDVGGARARDRTVEVARLVRTLVRVDPRYPEELVKVIGLNLENGARCADLVADAVQFGYSEKRRLLETADASERLGLLAELLRREIARSQVAGEVRTKTEISIDRAQREAFLREQLEIIRSELEELDPVESEITELEGKIKEALLPAIVRDEARREVQKLRDRAAREREGSSIRAWIEWVISMPWEDTTKDRLGLRRARRMLDDRFFNLGGARDRLLEFLAVRKLGGKARLPLLAILGPPGTGRTSLAATIAEVLGRRFVRIAMHGIHDEAEIRGERRHEAGARPGRILDGLREVGSRNPVILIDHIDRLEPRGGEPMLAVLEALDPDHHEVFRDHYLGVPFDLSEVLFVVTANLEEDVPEALWPFMYTIELSGYTDRVKVDIARKNIWPDVVEKHGLEDLNVQVTSAALKKIIRHYTREAGVRELKNQLEAICRRVAVKAATRSRRRFSIGVRNLSEYLGKPIYLDEEIAHESRIGAATGLAWTDAGGDLLPIEALLMPGEGYVMLTGLLGEVMEESVEAALSYVRSRGDELGIPADTFREKDLHIHFPEGAIPKDGPSAGIAVATAIASLLSRRPVLADVAMTGEISLQGRVLPVGAVREKALAAHRAGIKRVLLPRGNESDLAEVPREVRGAMQIRLVGDVSEVFRLALGKRVSGGDG